jgi:hypothetical protein
MSLSHFFTELMSPVVTPDAIRAEIYFLGSRHQGKALSGALEELAAPGLSTDRVRLLRAVVARLERE